MILKSPLKDTEIEKFGFNIPTKLLAQMIYHKELLRNYSAINTIPIYGQGIHGAIISILKKNHRSSLALTESCLFYLFIFYFFHINRQESALRCNKDIYYGLCAFSISHQHPSLPSPPMSSLK